MVEEKIIFPRPHNEQLIGDAPKAIEITKENAKVIDEVSDLILKEDDTGLDLILKKREEEREKEERENLFLTINKNDHLDIPKLKEICKEDDLKETTLCNTLDKTLIEECNKIEKKKGGKKSKRTRKRVRKTKKTKNKKTKRRARRTRKRS